MLVIRSVDDYLITKLVDDYVNNWFIAINPINRSALKHALQFNQSAKRASFEVKRKTGFTLLKRSFMTCIVFIDHRVTDWRGATEAGAQRFISADVHKQHTKQETDTASGCPAGPDHESTAAAGCEWILHAVSVYFEVLCSMCKSRHLIYLYLLLHTKFPVGLFKCNT